MVKNNKKQYIIKKYIMAVSAIEAIRIEKKFPVDDVWVDEEWKKSNIEDKKALGFNSK